MDKTKNKLKALEPLVSTPNYVEEESNWPTPFEDGNCLEKDAPDYIREALPNKYTVLGIRKEDKYTFTWTDNNHMFITWYWGDHVYDTMVKLDDGLWAKFTIDTCMKECSKELGNMLAEAAIDALEEENEYEHVIEFDEYDNEHIHRGSRIADKVPLEKLLQERTELEEVIERAKVKRELAKNKELWTSYIERRTKELEMLNILIREK